MTNNVRNAVGVRWKANGIRNWIDVEIFYYHQPHLRPLAKRTITNFDRSRWADIDLTVGDGKVVLRLDDSPPLVCDTQPAWHHGNFFGFYQNYGTGFLADIQVEADGQKTNYDDLIRRWNRVMVYTTRFMMHKTNRRFPTPDDFTGSSIPVRRIDLAGEWRVGVPVLCSSQLTFEATIPRDGILHAGYGILPPFALSSATAEFRITALSGGKEERLASKTLCPANESVRAFRYHDSHISLKHYAGKTIRLRFEVERQGNGEPLVACWSEPVIGSPAKKKHDNVLLIMLDTLRADRVGVYGSERNLTPTIDGLAENGVTFLNTVVQAPWTLPSHASLFTGLYPSETGCDRSGETGNVLQEAYTTWAECFQRRGYHTAAFTTGVRIRGEYGFNQGFDLYQDVEYDMSYSLEALHERMRAWLDDRRDEPWFLFVHTYAVHFPYKHQQYVDYRSIPRNWEDIRQIDVDAYDGGVRYADEWVGVLMRELEHRGLSDSTLTVITSDHGEDLGERGMPRPARHGHALYDEQLLVPLILHHPARLAPRIDTGKKITQQVRLLDLMPTVLDLMGWEPPVLSHGESLIPLIQGGETLERFAFSEAMTYGVPQISVRTNQFKLIVVPSPNARLDKTPTGVPVPIPEPILLFDLKSDPGETVNIASERPGQLKQMKRLLEIIQEQTYPAVYFTEGAETREPPVLSPELMEELEAMGYR